MSDLTFVQADTAPDILGTLTLSDGTPVDLSPSKVTHVRFQMRKSDDRRFTVNGEALVDDATAGRVHYRWGANDLAYPGEYQCQWEVTFSDGRIQTQAEPNTLTVRRQ